MLVTEAQQEVRTVFLGGSVGQAVSGLIWLASSAVATWVSVRYGILILVVGGIFIFPLTSLAIKALGYPGKLSNQNPLNGLAMQIAFTVPLGLFVVAGAALYNPNWFYPAFAIIVGSHYLPFIFLYGMRQFGVLAAALIGGGFVIARWYPQNFTLGGWYTGAILVVFAAIIWVTFVRPNPEVRSQRGLPSGSE